MRKLDKTETLVTIGDVTSVREVAETDFYNCMCFTFPVLFNLRIFGVSNSDSPRVS